MKTTLTFILCLLCIMTTQAQYSKNFKVRYKGKSLLFVIPTFTSQDTTKQPARIELKQIVQKQINKLFLQVFSQDELQHLSTDHVNGTKAFLHLYMDYTGKIEYIIFFIPPQDTLVLDENRLTKFYHLIQEMKVDTSNAIYYIDSTVGKDAYTYSLAFKFYERRVDNEKEE